MILKVSSPNAYLVAARFAEDALFSASRVPVLVLHYGQLLLTQIMRNASGRPGPNAPTGAYRRSWTITPVKIGPGYAQVGVGTSFPQGRRLEFGFHGTDSLGRFYNQPPYPHVGPAVDKIAPMFQAAMEEGIVQL